MSRSLLFFDSYTDFLRSCNKDKDHMLILSSSSRMSVPDKSPANQSFLNPALLSTSINVRRMLSSRDEPSAQQCLPSSGTCKIQENDVEQRDVNAMSIVISRDRERSKDLVCTRESVKYNALIPKHNVARPMPQRHLPIHSFHSPAAQFPDASLN